MNVDGTAYLVRIVALVGRLETALARLEGEGAGVGGGWGTRVAELNEGELNEGFTGAVLREEGWIFRGRALL